MRTYTSTEGKRNEGGWKADRGAHHTWDQSNVTRGLDDGTIQITAEQIVRDAKSQQEELAKPPVSKIADREELAEYQLKKRREFEDLVRRMRWSPGVWTKYAKFEESQQDFERARSVWERALEVDYRNRSMWLKYAEMEMRNRFVNHARNVWDRAVTLLPMIDQFWYKYIHMEEMLGNVAGARQIFERWLKWTPEYQAWRAYIKMELRYNEVERARKLYKRYVGCCNTADAWIEFAKFEMRVKQRENARGVYEEAVQELIGDLIPPEPEGVEEEKNVQEFYDEASKLLLAFASFEILCGEMDRARAIYSFALHTLPPSHAPKIEAARVALEKQYGTSTGVEVAVLVQRRRKYEEQVKADPRDYDAWYDLVRLEEQGGNIQRIRSTYQEVVQHPPPMAQNGGSIAAHEKMRWKRFVYLWIEYALFEEIMADDLTKANQVYRGIISMIPHKRFTFAKLWINAAEALIRTKDLPGTRKLLGQAVGLNPSKTKILDFYVDFELQLGNISRCRKILESALSRSQRSATIWIKFAKLESELEEDERARAILDLAIQQEELDSPELVWKHYIDFEIQMGEREKARALYEQLLSRTTHVKVWISYAAFEAAPITNELEHDDLVSRELRVSRAREVFKRGHSYLRGNEPNAKHECVALLEAWKSFEMEVAQGNSDSVWIKEVNALMPRRVKRRRPVEDSDIMEDFYEYIFPDEAAALPNLKLLEAAQRWKRQKLAGEGTHPDTTLLEGANDVPEEKTTDGT